MLDLTLGSISGSQCRDHVFKYDEGGTEFENQLLTVSSIVNSLKKINMNGFVWLLLV